ncbi:MAG TPA: cadmium resistance transporter [Pseudonocardia sp.]|nr:cadmium resistance transporter [Pseudonocardia sp.]
MSPALVPQAIGLFVGTNVDDIVVLALLFGQARDPGGVRRVVIGQYVGFLAILVLCVLGALGANLLPPWVLPWLGLIPLGLGLHAGWQVWRDHRGAGRNPATPGPGVGVVPLSEATDTVETVASVTAVARGPSITAVIALTLAGGADNVGVYIPAFAASGPWALAVYVPVFLVLVAAWCAAGVFVASRPVIVSSISRRGHILVPVVLVAIGLIILLG